MVAPSVFGVATPRWDHGAIVAVTSGIAITFFQNFLPDQVGTATNLDSNAMRVGGIAGYLACGSLAQVYRYRAVFVFCTVVCAIGLGLLLCSRDASTSRTGSTATPA